MPQNTSDSQNIRQAAATVIGLLRDQQAAFNASSKKGARRIAKLEKAIRQIEKACPSLPAAPPAPRHTRRAPQV